MHVLILNVNLVVIGTLAKTLDGKSNDIFSRQRLAVQNLILLDLRKFLIWWRTGCYCERESDAEACVGRLFIQYQEVMIVDAGMDGGFPVFLQPVLNHHYRFPGKNLNFLLKNIPTPERGFVE